MVAEWTAHDNRANNLLRMSKKHNNFLRNTLCNNLLFIIGPIPWGHSGPLCHALSLLSLSWTSMRRRRATVATPGEWQCKTGGVRRLAVANGPNIFQMLLVYLFIIMYEIVTSNEKDVCPSYTALKFLHKFVWSFCCIDLCALILIRFINCWDYR